MRLYIGKIEIEENTRHAVKRNYFVKTKRGKKILVARPWSLDNEWLLYNACTDGSFVAYFIYNNEAVILKFNGKVSIETC